MTILAQHGYAKGDKIDQGIADGSIGGVIISPRDEPPSNVESYLASLPRNVERMVDPQLYVGTLIPAKHGQLKKYGHYKDNLTVASFAPAAITRFVRDALDWQKRVDVSTLVSPTVMVDDLGSRWAQIAMNLAQETANQRTQRKTATRKPGDR